MSVQRFTIKLATDWKTYPELEDMFSRPNGTFTDQLRLEYAERDHLQTEWLSYPNADHDRLMNSALHFSKSRGVVEVRVETTAFLSSQETPPLK